MRTRRLLAAALVAIAIAVSAAPVAADEYDPQRSAHPLRIVAYVVHPVGVVLDLLIFRPAHWIGTKQPFAALFGHERYRD